ncbi:caspase family protein [Micromonospora sp. NPDC005197]|uniref:caspase, EACC1-associated type n=1 Tax=Micromonospora sp. NPDC005197 TaxID=3157020 RepID=UPI0033B0D710
MPKKALLIACSEFGDRRLPQLASPVADASRLAKALRRSGVGDFDVTIVANPTLRDAQIAIHEVFANVRADDLAFVHLSGHGIKDANGRFYFAVPDTDVNALPATALSGRYLREQLNDTSARQIVLALDCCYSGAFGRDLVAKSITNVVGLPEELSGSGRAVMTASSAIQIALEYTQEDVAASLFTQALADGLLTGLADLNGDGWITLTELYQFASAEVRKRNSEQTPELNLVGLNGDIVIARAPTVVRPADSLDDDVAIALESHHYLLRLAAVQIIEGLMYSRDHSRASAAKGLLRKLRSDEHPAVRDEAGRALFRGPKQRRRTLKIQERPSENTTAQKWAVVRGEALAKAAELVSNVVSADNGPYYRSEREQLIANVLVVHNGECLNLMATDKYQAISLDLPVMKGEVEFKGLLSGFDILSLRAFRRSAEVMLLADVHRVEVIAGNKFIAFDCHLDPEAYPPLQSILNAGPKGTIVEISRIALLDAVNKTISLTLDGYLPWIVLEYGLAPDEIRVWDSMNVGRESFVVPAVVSGRRVRVALNSSYLLNALEGFRSPTIRLGIENSQVAVSVTSPQETSHRRVIMPIRSKSGAVVNQR